MPATNLRQAVYARLSGSSAITALVGTRIYVGAVPQTTSLLAGPALSYSVPSRQFGHVLVGADGTSSARVSFSAWSTSESVSDQVIQAVRDRFDGFAGTIGSVVILGSILQSEVDIPEPPKAGTDQWIYQITADYLISHRVSLPVSLGA